ncbi:MAG: hypothetical protein EOO04_02755 [Chitinophagaceae bacterium]|nr:MAG: hypothetical protein EOO04_02755 [Chitinophagaceae bacterium]
MRLPLSLWTVMLLCAHLSYGQRKTVVVDPDSRKMNQGNRLPAQTYFDIQVPVSDEIGIIQVNIHKGRNNDNLIEKASWSRPINFRSNLAEIPIDIQLKSNASYTFDMTIYSMLSDSESVHLRGIVHQNIRNYLNAAFETNNKGITTARKTEQVLSDLNGIVTRSLKDFRSLRDTEFEGFSDIVKLKLQQVDNARLSNAAFNIQRTPADTLATDTSLKADYAVKLMDELQSIIFSEVDNYLDTDFVKLYDKLVIRNQVTERTQTVLPLFIGYGGVYLGGNVDNLEYDSQPYAGFSIPFGRGNGAWFSRTSFVLGVFINNFKDADDNTITGPVVDRPVFAGLGFRIYDFIHFNAGVVATSTAKQNLSNIKTENIDLQPFIGINAQFNLWLGLNKKQ